MTKGERVSGKASGGVVVGQGAFKDRRLSIEMHHQGKAYDFTAALKDGRLTGQWKGKDDKATGTWSADRFDTAPAEEKSPAVVPLYEYSGADGRREYSTDLPDNDLKRKPICLVWANPMTVLALDPGVKPVPIELMGWQK